MNKEKWIFAGLVGIFLVAYFLPLDNVNVQTAILDAFRLLQRYAVDHTLGSVVPAMFIAGAIATFVSKESILKHLGPKALCSWKGTIKAYGVASIAGTILAVCSCSVLPVFAGIYRIGAGLGPAATFLVAGPAINIMAISLTAHVLGLELGIARTVTAIGMSLIIGLLMALIFYKSEEERIAVTMQLPDPLPSKRELWQTVAFLTVMIVILVFNDCCGSGTKSTCIDNTPTSCCSAPKIFPYGWYIWFASVALLAAMIVRWFERDELKEWMRQTWWFTKAIIPLLFGGIFITGFITSLLPADIVAQWVGGNSFQANVIASIVGAFWYFATLTEIPILQALMGLGMGKGPALTLLLAGPTLSLPSMIVICQFLGVKKGLTFALLIVIISAVCGMTFGYCFP